MKSAFRRRHLFFLSTSLAAHLLFILAVAGVLFIVSDTPVTDSSRPLVVSLDRGDETGGAPAPETAREDIPSLRKEPAPPDTPVTKVSGDTGPPGGVSGIAGTGGGGDRSVLSDYIRNVRARINRHKRYPPEAAREGIEGTVTVSFLLGRSGAVLDKRIAVGSGHPALDEAALAAIGDSSPFPPFPDTLPLETLLLRLPINYRQR